MTYLANSRVFLFRDADPEFILIHEDSSNNLYLSKEQFLSVQPQITRQHPFIPLSSFHLQSIFQSKNSTLNPLKVYHIF